MTIEVLSIGNELLSGKTINKNGASIGRILFESGYRLERITTLSDHFELIKEEMEQALNRAAFVVTTGGLGPTQDDQTRRAASALINAPLIADQSAKEELCRRFGSNESILRDQTSIPKGAIPLPNSLGTAWGFALKVKSSMLIALPGVPLEMEAMLKQALPLFEKKLPKWAEQKALFFCLLCEYQFDSALRELKKTHPFVEIGICLSYGMVAIYLSMREKGKTLERIATQLSALFPTHFFSTASSSVEQALQGALVKQSQTVAVAESCTGGKLSARLTALPGISAVFIGGVIAYSNKLKETLLKVPYQTLEKEGAVSRQTVLDMASGLLDQTAADYVLATSGIVGPDGGTKEKPVGTIWVALGDRKQEIYTHCLHLPQKRGRSFMINYVATYLFASLWRYLVHSAPPFEENA